MLELIECDGRLTVTQTLSNTVSEEGRETIKKYVGRYCSHTLYALVDGSIHQRSSWRKVDAFLTNFTSCINIQLGEERELTAEEEQSICNAIILLMEENYGVGINLKSLISILTWKSF